MASPHDDMLKDCMTPLDKLLMNYAAGRLDEQEKLLVTAARALNPDVRCRIAQFEAMGAHLMCAEAPAPVSEDCLSIIMKRIDDAPQAQPVQQSAALKAEPVPDLPIHEMVHALIANVCAHRQAWSYMRRGVMRMELTMRAPQAQPKTVVQKRLRLMKLAPQQAAPRHAHLGTEITLVLHGAYSDELGEFKKGDVIIITDRHFAHEPKAGDEGCICLTLTEARLRFHDPMARLMNTFWRI